MIMCNNYNVYIRQILLGKPCVLAYTTAADYLGLSNGGLREYVEIFVEKYIDIPNTKQFLVPSFLGLKTNKINGLLCTTSEQTIINLLEQDGDNQIIQETMANYYYKHNETFENLDIPTKLQEKFDRYSKWAIHYYDD